MSEEDPLLSANQSRRCDNQSNRESTRSGSSTSCCQPCKVPKWLWLCILFTMIGFFSILLVSLVISFSVKLDFYKNPNTYRIMTETRSGNFSLLDHVPPFSACAVAHVRLELVDAQSLVDVQKVPCDTIPMSRSLVHIPYNGIELIGVPFTLFSENRSPNNYFVNGTLQVDMVNVTLTNSSSSVVDSCFFTKSEKFEKFSKAGLDWKDFIKDASCERATLHDGEHNHSLSFNITSPSFIFLGIASEDMLEIDVNLIVMGYTIDGFGNQSVDSCQLNGDNVKCDFNASARNDQSECIVAYEPRDGTGSIYYSNIEITQTIPSDVCIKTIVILGSTALGSLVFLIVISVIVVIKWKCKSKRNDSTVSSESLVDTAAGNARINSEEEDTGTATGGQSDTAASVSTPEESDHATNTSAFVYTGSSKLLFSSRPSTVEEVSEASKTNIPVQATVQGPDLNSELPSKSTENISDSRFSYGHPETVSD